MRIAVFSDTHGNSIALDAVLADIDAEGGVDAHWFLGDAAPIRRISWGSGRIAAQEYLSDVHLLRIPAQ